MLDLPTRITLSRYHRAPTRVAEGQDKSSHTSRSQQECATTFDDSLGSLFIMQSAAPRI